MCVEKSIEELKNSQSTLCARLSRMLKAKSNKGRPRKRAVHQKNPFEIDTKFRIRKVNNVGVEVLKKIGGMGT